MLMILNLNNHKDLIQQVWYEKGTSFVNLLILIHGKCYMLRFLDIVLIIKRVRSCASGCFIAWFGQDTTFFDQGHM